MTDRFDLRRSLPWLRGRTVHVVAADQVSEVSDVLRDAHFVVHRLDGRKISDANSFFREAARAFHLPAHFGHNWDALIDVLGDWESRPDRRIAILWQHVDHSVRDDLQAVVDAVVTFQGVADDLAKATPSLQLETFLLS